MARNYIIAVLGLKFHSDYMSHTYFKSIKILN